MRKTLFITAILLPFVFAKSALATDPHFYLSPASGSFSSAFDVQVKVDTGGQAIGAADIYLSFPKDKFSVLSFTKTTIFTEIHSLIKNEEGKLTILGFFSGNDAGQSFIGSDGLIGTVKFSPLAAGTAAVAFTCTAGQTNETNIVEKVTSQDIVVCSANVGGSYTLTTGGGPTATPGPTNTPAPGPTNTPAPGPTSTPVPGAPTATPTVPVTGMAGPTFGFLGLGILVILTGLVLAF